MEEIVSWVKNYSMVVLFLTVLTSLTSKKEYRRYLQVFVEIVLVITLLMPVLKLTGKDTDFFDKIAYDSLWQELDSIKAERKNFDFLQEDVYLKHYGNVIEADVEILAKEAGYGVLDTKVSLNDEFVIEKMELNLVKIQDSVVIQGSVEELPEEKEITDLKEKIADIYHMDIENITIKT